MKAMGSPTEGIYRRLTVRMYGDERFMQLTPPQPCGQWLWVYALTGPHTGAIPGVFVMGKAAMAEALGWEAEAFEKAFAEVLAQGLVEFDTKSRMWFIPKAIRHNMPANPNVVRSWRGAWSLLPECATRARIADALFTSLSGLSAAFGEAFLEASGKASRKPLPKDPPKQETGNRKQEQEQQAGTEVGAAANGSGPAPKSAASAAEAAPRRGTRIPADWVLPKLWGEWAIAQYPHWTADTVRSIAKKFHNHWKSTTKNATKLDWKATWENWCTNDITQRENPPPLFGAGSKSSVGFETAAAEAARLLGIDTRPGGINETLQILERLE